MADGDDVAARMVRLRAESARGGAGPILVGSAAIAIAAVLLALTLGAKGGLWFWLYVGTLLAVSLTSAMLLAAFRISEPSDQELLDRWLPRGRAIGLILKLAVLVSPWIVLPLAEGPAASALYLMYACFLAFTAMGSDEREMVAVTLVGVPLSIGAYLIVAGAPFAWPVAAILLMLGIGLSYYAASRRKALATTLEARAVGEQQAAEFMKQLAALTHAATPFRGTSASVPDMLTPRQLEVLRKAAAGLSNKEIARELGISPATVKVHVAQILAATQAPNRTAAVASLLRQEAA